MSLSAMSRAELNARFEAGDPQADRQIENQLTTIIAWRLGGWRSGGDAQTQPADEQPEILNSARRMSRACMAAMRTEPVRLDDHETQEPRFHDHEMQEVTADGDTWLGHNCPWPTSFAR
jgi:hypothetical protein